MPIIIRETTIRANLSNNDADVPKNGQDHPIVTTEPVTDLEGKIQKFLLRKLKTRDER